MNALVAELIEDQRQRSLRGELRLVEAYLVAHEELERDPESVIELLVREFRLRKECGEAPSPDEYLARFPQFADRLERQFLLQEWIKADGCSAAANTIDVSREETDLLGPASQPDELGRLATYRVLRVLGSGGMGQVFLAEDTQLKRQVALKVMHPQLAADAESRQRFLREARAIAALTHDHIVTIYQVGEDRGLPYLAMQYLLGATLEDYIQRRQDSGDSDGLANLLRVGRETAIGLQAAHGAGLVHRDIKPSNIWLEADSGRVKILDFGLVHTLNADSGITQHGSVIGTPAYMAPEQGRDLATDPRSDLFSLGCVLYRLASGQLPFQGRDTMAVLRSVSLHQPLPLCQVKPQVPSNVSDLVMQLLEKDPAARPASAREVAERIETIEEGSAATSAAAPVVDEGSVRHPDRPPQAATRTPAPQRRQQLLTFAAALLIPAGILLFSQIVIRIRDKDGKETVVTVPAGSEVTVQDGEAEFRFPATDRPQKSNPVAFNQLSRESIPDYELAAAGGGDSSAAPRELVAVLGDSRMKHSGTVRSVAFSPDGSAVVSAGWRVVTVWDAASGRARFSCRGHLGEVRSAEFSGDGRLLASGDAVGDVRLWHAQTGQLVKVLPRHTPYITRLMFNRDATRLAVASKDTVKVWDVKTGSLVLTLDGHTDVVNDVAYSPDGSVLATAGRDKSARLWNAESGAELAQLPGISHEVHSVDFFRDGMRLVTGEARRFQVWDVPERKIVVQPPLGISDGPARINGSGSFIAAAFHSQIAVWDVELGAPYRTLHGHSWIIEQIAFSPDGRRLVSGGEDGVVRIWDVASGELLSPVRGHFSAVTHTSLSQDGTRLVTATRHDRTAAIWDTAQGKRVYSIQDPDRARYPIFSTAFSPNGKWLAVSNFQKAVKVWNVDDRTEQWQIPHRDQVGALAFSADSKRLAVAGWRDRHSVWDLESQTEALTLQEPGKFSRIAFSPDGNLLAGAALYGTLCLWDAASGTRKPISNPPRLDAFPSQLAFSSDSQYLATRARDSAAACVLDCTTGDTLPAKQQRTWAPIALAFSPNSRVLATGRADGQLALSLLGAAAPMQQWQLSTSIVSLTFSTDGRHLVIGNGNSTVYVFRLHGWQADSVP